jgi:hypothetical protein
MASFMMCAACEFGISQPSKLPVQIIYLLLFSVLNL